jgi:hypothetical protein
VVGATLVGIGALILGFGLMSLGAGAQALEGVNFVWMAAKLFIGGFLLALAGPAFVVGATLVGIGALILGFGLMSLGAGAQALEGVDFVAMAAKLFIGGFLLALAGPAFVAGAYLVGYGALILGFGLMSLGAGAQALKDIDFVAMAAQLFIGGFLLLAASLILPFAAYMLFRASLWLLPAAIGVYVGMSWLESATRRFKSSTDDISKMSEGLAGFAHAFDVLARADIGAIDNAVESALDAMPGMKKLAREIDSSAALFQTAADKFVGPVREIAGSLEELGTALAGIGSQGVMMEGDMDKISGMLEQYTQLLEGTAERIELAVVAKAQPAMATARSEGLEDAVRSEAITTVQVMDKTEGDAERVDEQTVLLSAIAGSLGSINDQLEAVGGGGTELPRIVELLEQHLPEITGSEEGLTTEFNQWMK